MLNSQIIKLQDITIQPKTNQLNISVVHTIYDVTTVAVRPICDVTTLAVHPTCDVTSDRTF